MKEDIPESPPIGLRISDLKSLLSPLSHLGAKTALDRIIENNTGEFGSFNQCVGVDEPPPLPAGIKRELTMFPAISTSTFIPRVTALPTAIIIHGVRPTRSEEPVRPLAIRQAIRAYRRAAFR